MVCKFGFNVLKSVWNVCKNLRILSFILCDLLYDLSKNRVMRIVFESLGCMVVLTDSLAIAQMCFFVLNSTLVLVASRDNIAQCSNERAFFTWLTPILHSICIVEQIIFRHRNFRIY